MIDEREPEALKCVFGRLPASQPLHNIRATAARS